MMYHLTRSSRGTWHPPPRPAYYVQSCGPCHMSSLGMSSRAAQCSQWEKPSPSRSFWAKHWLTHWLTYWLPGQTHAHVLNVSVIVLCDPDLRLQQWPLPALSLSLETREAGICHIGFIIAHSHLSRIMLSIISGHSRFIMSKWWSIYQSQLSCHMRTW